jgi:multidrug efflux pump subunit AcrB
VEGIEHIFTTVGSAQGVGGGNIDVGEVRKGTLMVALAERGPPAQPAADRRSRCASASTRCRVRGSRSAPANRARSSRSSSRARTRTRSRTARAPSSTTCGGCRTWAASFPTASLERPRNHGPADLSRAAERGVTTQAIGDTVAHRDQRRLRAELAKLNLDNRQIDIRVKVPEDVRTDLQAIGRPAGSRAAWARAAVERASLTVESGPSQIDRYNRERQISISADLAVTPLGNAIAARKEPAAVRALPSSVHLIESGDAEFMSDLFGGFAVALLTGVLCVYCVLVLLFRDWFQPVTILSAVPLSVGGAFVALLLGRSELGLPSLIGLVMLLGIVTKNSILLVEYAVIGIRERGLSEHDALLDACRKRARPILMTSVAMIAGMLPLALGLVGDGSFRVPMAIAVIGGLVTSTALSLLVVPVVFTYVARFERWLTGHGVTVAHRATEPAVPR